MQILILGGTGAMGKHLVNILRESKHNITVTSRKTFISNIRNVNYIVGDAHDDSFLISLFKNTKYDAIIDFMHYSTIEFKARHNLLLSNTSHYFFLSSSRVYAESQTPITEESPRLLDIIQDREYLATDDYALSKARQEDILKDSGKNNYTIIRPYITFSEERLQLGIFEKEDWLNRALNNKNIVFSKDIAFHYTSLTYGRDVAYGIAKLIGNKNAFGETFHIANSNSILWNDIALCYSRVLKNMTNKITDIIYENSCFYLEGITTKWSVKYSRLFDYRFDNSKILSFVPDLTFTDTLDGLEKCLISFLNNPHFKRINPYPQARMDRLSHSFQSITTWNDVSDVCKYLFYRFAPLKIIRKRLAKSNNKS